MQSSKQSQNQKALMKQSVQSMKKTIVPFNQQLINLQKKIQQVQSKNELILQKIHKAYDFKKAKNKVYYQASQDEEQQQSDRLNSDMEHQRIQDSINNPRSKIYPNSNVQYKQPQPRQFQVNSGRKQVPRLPLQGSSNRYYQQQILQQQMLQQRHIINPVLLSSSSPSSGNDLPSQLQQNSFPQQQTQNQYQYNQQQIQPQQQQQQTSQNQQNQQQQQSDQDFKSSSNYSDIEKRRRISENVRKRQKDFSDIKSSFQDRKYKINSSQLKKQNKQTPKKSYIFNSIENNSSYSEGNLPSKDNLHPDDVQMIDSPVTTNQTKFRKPKSPYQQSTSIVNQQHRYPAHSTNQIYRPHSYIPQGPMMNSVPNLPEQLLTMAHSVTGKALPYQPSISQSQVNFLSGMFKVQRQKTLTLQKQIEQKQQNIQHLKKYKKAFRRFRDHTFHLFEQAFDQYVQTFLRNRLYKIEKAMRKNENKLSALLMQVKDFKEERAFNLSLRKNLNEKLNKRSYSSNDQPLRQNPFQQHAQQQAFQQNYSTISNRSRERSISAKRRKSQDKSLTKKSNQSQHLMMKKQFTNIAENYQAMIKVKNQELQKYEYQIKQTTQTIQTLQEQNNRLKLQCQQQQTQLQTQQLQNQFTGSVVESQQPRRNSGNLRILSRSSSKSDIKKNINVNNNVLAQQNQQLIQKIKKYQQQIEKLIFQNSSFQQQLDGIHHQNLTNQSQIKLLSTRILEYEHKIVPLKQETILTLETTISRLTKDYQELNGKNVQLNGEIESMRLKLNEKDKKILQLDSAIYIKNNEIKKIQNLLTLKNYKLEQFNKLLLTPSSTQPLNDSISSIIQQPQNKSTFIMLQNLQKQLQQQKHEKQVQFLKLKRTYQSKIQHLKIQFQQIVQQNQKLSQKLNNQTNKEKQWEYEKQQLNDINIKLKQQIQTLQKQIAFLNDKVNFYQTQRQTGKTASFADSKRKTINQNSSGKKIIYINKQSLIEQDFDDFPDFELNDNKNNNNSISSWKPVSGQIQLLDESSTGNINYSIKKTPSQQNTFQLKRTGSINQNMQIKLSAIKDQNIQLSQKLAKLQKQNSFMRQNQIQSQKKYQQLKNQLNKFSQKYQELQLNNQQLIKLVQQLQKQKLQFQKNNQQNHGTPPINWKDVQRNIQPVELKGSGMYSPWTFAQKDDILLQKSSRQFDIRQSVVSNFHANRPSRQSVEMVDKRVEQLTRKLAQTQLLLGNKQRINQQLIIGFTKKVDRLNTQIQQQSKEQSKVIQKYIQQNSRLRRQKQKLQQQIELLKVQIQKQRLINEDKEKLNKINNNKQNQILEQQIDLNEDDFNDNEQQQQGGFGLMQQRIDGFMLGINQDQQQQNKQLSKQKQKQLLKQKQQQQLKQLLKQQLKQLPKLQKQLLTKQKHFKPMFVQQQQQQIQFQDFQQKNQKIQLLQKQIKQLQQTIQKLQLFLQQTLNKVKSKQQEKLSLAQQLQQKNIQVEELKDLIQLKQIGQSHTLTLSKSINYGHPERSSIEKSDRPRLNSITSLKYSQTNQGQKDRKLSFDQQLNFDFLDSNANKSINLDHSHISGMYSQNMSMIFDKQENFLDQIRKAKNKRKQQGKLLKKTFDYIKKLRSSLNDKNKKIKILQIRIQELKDNCWLWKKNNQPQSNSHEHCTHAPSSFQTGRGDQQMKPQHGSNQHSYLDHNQTLSDGNNKLVDSRLFQCNSQDLNKKKPHRHNHYKKLQYDTKLIVQENKILTNQIQLLQQELIKIQQQQNGLMAVKQLYKQQIRALNKQNQQQSIMFQQQVQKLQQKLQSSQQVHNFQAIKQLFKRIIDSVGIMLHPNTSPQIKKKAVNQLKQQKRKQAQQCIKVICSILNYEDNIKHQLSLRLCGQQQHAA